MPTGSSVALLAGGTITVSSFITLNDGTDTPAMNTAWLAVNTTAMPFGISGEAADAAPIPGNASTVCAVAGEQFQYFGPGEECYLILGTGGATAGDRLGADASGHGVTNTTNNTTYGAVALETAAAAAKIKVRVELGWISNA